MSNQSKFFFESRSFNQLKEQTTAIEQHSHNGPR
jgi:hypothetical protein